MSEDAARQPETIQDFDALSGARMSDLLGFNHACVSCGYNLRGLAIGASCPECNKKVAQSLSKRYLHNANRKWVRSMRRGAMLLTICTLLPIVSFCVVLPIFIMAGAALSASSGGVASAVLLAILSMLPFVAIWLAYLLGWIFLTAREPGTQLTTDANAARSRCRSWSIIVAIAIPALTIVGIIRMGTGMFTGGGGVSASRELIEVLFLALAPSVVLAVQSWFAARHVRHLCGRLNGNGLAVYAMVIFWVVAADGALGTSRAALQYYGTRQVMAQFQTMAMNMPQTAPAAPGAAPTTPQSGQPVDTTPQATATPTGGVQSAQSGVTPQAFQPFPQQSISPMFIAGAIIGGIHSLLSIALYGMYIGFCAWLWAKLARAAKPKFAAD